MFSNIKKYLHIEYNLFTLKKLIPIENNTALCEESGIFIYFSKSLFVKLFDSSCVQSF